MSDWAAIVTAGIAVLGLAGYARYAHSLASAAMAKNAVLEERVSGVDRRLKEVEDWAFKLISGLAQVAPRIEALADHVGRMQEAVEGLRGEAREEVKEAKRDRHDFRNEVHALVMSIEDKMEAGIAEIRKALSFVDRRGP